MTAGALADMRLGDVDAAVGNGFRLALDRADGLIDLVVDPGPVETLRFSAVDLRAAARVAGAQRRAAAERGRPVSLMLDIEVLLDDEPAGAWRRLAERERDAGVPHRPASLLYVGTPRGLAGLLADIHVMGIADGATLLPLSEDSGWRIRGQVLPQLQSNDRPCAR